MNCFDECSDDSTHPFQSSTIVQRILEYIPHHQYKELRKISRIWNQESCKLIQLQEVVTLGTASNCAKYTRLFQRSSEIQSHFPYPHTSFQFPKIRMHLIYYLHILRRFFSTIGLRIKHLNLSLTKIKFKMKFLRIIIFRYVRNLESLTINFYNFDNFVQRDLYDDQVISPMLNLTELSVYGYGNPDHLRAVLTQILSCMPNLKKIEAGEVQGRLLFDIIYGQTMSSMTVPCSFINITDLELGSLCLNQINKIINNKISLKTLTAEVDRHVEVSQIQTLLDHMASDIEQLKLEYPSTSPQSEVLLRFPSPLKAMLKLVKLEICRFEMDISIISSTTFPVLKNLKLSLTELCYEENEVCYPSDNLHYLTLNICRGLTPNLIKNCAKSFPKLKKLDVRTHPFKNREDVLTAICEHLTDLEELRINQEALTMISSRYMIDTDILETNKSDLLIPFCFLRKMAMAWRSRSKSI